jgi:pimeloyl-ACP methyl ester carboxylesterase
VSVAFALKYPERVERLILVDPAVGGGGGGRFPSWIMPLLATPQMRHLGPLLVRSIAQTGNDTIRMAWHDPARVTDEIINGYRNPLKAYDWDKALYEFTIAARSGNLQARMSELKMPLLIITGDDDRIVPTQSTLALAQGLPSAELVVIKNCGHVPHEECPGDFMAAVESFIK